MSDLHRKQRLAHLIATDFGGRQDSFVQKSGRGKGRVSQMLGAEHPFGERAARLLAEDVGLDPDWFNNSWPTPNEVAQGVGFEGNIAPAALGGAPTLAQALEVLWECIELLSPVLHGPARDLIAKLARGEASLQETAKTLDAFAHASKSLPMAPALAETPIKVHRDN